MKVAFPNPSGIPIWEVSMVENLRNLNVDAKFIVPSPDSRVPTDLYKTSLALRGIKPIDRMINRSAFSQFLNNFFNIRTVEYTSRIYGLKKNAKEFDIMHFPDAVFIPVKQAIRLQKKVVMTVWENNPMGPQVSIKKPGNSIWKDIKSKIDHYFPVSEDSSYMLKLNGIDSQKITKIHPGIDTAKFSRKSNSEYLELMNPEHKFLILGVGRIQYEKGLTFILRALRLLKDQGKDFLYMHVGAGSPRYLNYIMKLVEFLGLKANFKWLGYLSYYELPNFYSIGDLFVLTSIPNFYWEEQMGFSTIEAMSCGVIPIVSDHTSTSEVVPPDCGFLVPAGNPQKLAQAILKVMDNMIDIKNMQSNCVKHVRNEYEAKNTAKSYYEVYKRILEKDS